MTVPVFGVSQSPLVEGDHLIALLGGEPDAMVVAFDKATGAEVWRAIETTSEPGYSSPIVIDAGGVRQLIVWHAAAVTSLDPATGAVWWQHDFVVPSGLTIGTPVRSGRYLLVTQVENGGLMLALNSDRPAARPLWTGENPSRTDRPPQGATLSTPVVAGDALYGLSSYGEFRGLDAATGERLWSTDRLTPHERWANSYLVRNGDRWFVVNETGELVIARFTPAGVRGGRPDAAADADHPHPRRRLRPLGRPGRPLGAPRVREPPRGGAERRRGRAPVARGRGLRIAEPRGAGTIGGLPGLFCGAGPRHHRDRHRRGHRHRRRPADPEFGLRLALGTARGSILAMVLRQGLVLVRAGLAIGAAAAASRRRRPASSTRPRRPTDVGIFAAVSLVCVLTGLAACCLPARRRPLPSHGGTSSGTTCRLECRGRPLRDRARCLLRGFRSTPARHRMNH